MADTTLNVLFLCTGNSARSILAEAILNRAGAGRFRGFSAGSHPKGAVHPLALELLAGRQDPLDALSSKSWDVFAAPDAPRMDLIFTVCDDAAAEACPVWLGHPLTVHWGIPDPARAEGSDAERRMAFAKAHERLERRIAALLDLPLASLTPPDLKARLKAIGQIKD